MFFLCFTEDMLRVTHNMRSAAFIWSSFDNFRYFKELTSTLCNHMWCHIFFIQLAWFYEIFGHKNSNPIAHSLSVFPLSPCNQSRALGMIRSHVLSVLRSTSSQVNLLYVSLLYAQKYLTCRWMVASTEINIPISSGSGCNTKQWR